MESVWSKEVEIPERSALEGDLQVEAAVIGGGMTGILTAYALKCQGKRLWCWRLTGLPAGRQETPQQSLLVSTV